MSFNRTVLPDVFTAVKQSVTARQVAEMYGIEVKPNGMACCPFHNDRNPSMKLDERYYCFGCHASGDAIDFVANLFQIGSREAAMRIAMDFRIAYDAKGRIGRSRNLTPEQRKEGEKRRFQKDFRAWRRKTLSDLNGDYRILTEKAERYAPTDPAAPFPKGYVEAYNDREKVEFYIGLLETAPEETQTALYTNEHASIEALHARVHEPRDERVSIQERLEAKKRLVCNHQTDNASANPREQQATL